MFCVGKLLLLWISFNFLLIWSPSQVKCISVHGEVAFSMKTWKSDIMVLYGLLTSTDQPSTLGPSPGMRHQGKLSRTSIQRWCSSLALSPRTAAVIEAAASTCRMWLESDKPASSFSLCCVAFSTHHRVPWVTGWLTSSKTAPLINIWAAQRCLSSPFMSLGSPFLSLGQMPGHAGLFEACLLRWSTTTS